MLIHLGLIKQTFRILEIKSKVETKFLFYLLKLISFVIFQIVAIYLLYEDPDIFHNSVPDYLCNS